MNLYLYEHQSTYNPNIPLRNLFYIADEYQRLVVRKSLYSTVIQKIPTPRFLVFYNGTKQYAYVLTLFDKEYIDIYKDIYTNGSLLLSKQFLIKVCIIWKDFLSDSFFDCLKCEACEQCQQKSQV